MPPYELVVISFSHYCERARWALDRYQVPYRERRFLPLLQAPAVLWRTRGRRTGWDRASSPLSTPLLTGPDVQLQDSQGFARKLPSDQNPPLPGAFS